jgi:protein transport protein HofC
VIDDVSSVDNYREPPPRSSGGLRLQTLMFGVVVCALLAWLAVTAHLAIVAALVLLIVLFAGAFTVLLVRRGGMQQDSLLWSLAIASERSLPLAPAALAFEDHYGSSYRWRVQLFASLLDQGVPLPAALDRVPGLMSREAQVLVRTGHATGTLPQALREAARLRSVRKSAWGEAASKFVYLGMVILSLQTISSFILYFIVPKFEAIFKDFGVKLPPVTVVTIQASRTVIVHPVVLIPVYLFEVAALCLLPLALFNVFQWDLPLFDALFRRRHTALLLRSLALAVEGGRPVGPTLEALATDYPSSWVRRRLRSAAVDTQLGSDWLNSLERRGLLGPSDAAVLASAERAGNLVWALREMAGSNERRLGYRVRVASQIIFPLVVAALGGLVFFMAVAYFSPLVVLIERLAG